MCVWEGVQACVCGGGGPHQVEPLDAEGRAVRGAWVCVAAHATGCVCGLGAHARTHALLPPLLTPPPPPRALLSRWGDAPVHTLAVALLLDKQQMYHAGDIGGWEGGCACRGRGGRWVGGWGGVGVGSGAGAGGGVRVGSGARARRRTHARTHPPRPLTPPPPHSPHSLTHPPSGYRHGDSQHCPEDSNMRGQCDCDPRDNAARKDGGKCAIMYSQVRGLKWEGVWGHEGVGRGGGKCARHHA